MSTYLKDYLRAVLAHSSRRLSSCSLKRSLDDYESCVSHLAEKLPDIATSFEHYISTRLSFLLGNCRIKDLSIPCEREVLGKQANAGKSFMRLCEMLSTMPSLEALWLMTSMEIKSHASITEIQAHTLRFVLPNLAAACCRLHYVEIGGMAWHGAFTPRSDTQSSRSALSKKSIVGSQLLKVPLHFCAPQTLGHDVICESR